ncbi:MAG TPA: cation diffusion facilitator family transporter [Capillimicrobium sp.]|nr:cation diffusion facilitator family transporter [Capillimicrobium sp.]
MSPSDPIEPAAPATGGGGHDHDHDGHDHSHAPSADADRRLLTIALAIIASFMLVEVVAGLVANSVALLSDAAHMLTDAGSIALALVAARLALRPVTSTFTFGLRRAEVLSAQINGISLVVLAAVLGVESVRRLLDPSGVEGGIVIVVGVCGALVNVAAAWTLAKAERQSLNVAGARAHVLADLYGSIAATIGGIAVVTLGFERADPLAAMVVVCVMLRSGWRLIRDSGRVLLEATPRGMSSAEIGRAMSEQPGIREVHDLHVWEVTSGFPALAAHVLVAEGDDCHRRRRELQAMLRERFGIEHTTLQVDHERTPQTGLLTIADPRAPDG